jgi:hypothetical protein
MQKFFALLLVSAITLTVNSQYSKEKECCSHFGISVCAINSGSGHGFGISMNAFVFKGRKSLEAGAIYQVRQDKISGADIKYKIFLIRNKDLIYSRKSVFPYLQYNLIYHKAKACTPVIININKSTIELHASVPGAVTTIEHYASLGFQLKLYGGIYADNNIGLGIYLGSIDKQNKPQWPGLHKDNFGFTISFKLGIGYRFN